MAEKPVISRLDKVTFTDWLLALIGLLFILVGLVIIQKDFKAGITTLSFFGVCFAVFVHTILRKLRLQRQSPLTVAVVGGVPIRPSRLRAGMFGLGLVGLGGTLALFRPGDSLIFLGCALLMVAVGGVIVVGLVTGFLPKSYLQFDPPGITFGYWGGKVTIPWSAITEVARGEIHGNQAVFIGVVNEAVTAEPPSYLAKVQKKMASSRAWTGADFVIMNSLYGIDAPILVAAMERYITSPEARTELRPAPALMQDVR